MAQQRRTSGARQTRRQGAAPRARKSTARSTKSTRASTSRRRTTTRASAKARGPEDRIRELNERIIEAGKRAGTATLDLYEGALKSIADMLERGADASDVEWVSRVMTSQADFIREVAQSWTGAARKSLK
jgi:major membrane immunogen (membrane-anchored lipoprotein)